MLTSPNRLLFCMCFCVCLFCGRGDTNGDSKWILDKTVCGLQRESNRLKGAQITGIDEFPWMALLMYKYKNGTEAGFKCGGTLINEKYVLTAAHCVKTSFFDFHVASVRLGEWRISTVEDCVEDEANRDCADPVVDVNVVDENPHPFYRTKTGDNDIALLRLENKVNYTDFIRPICLPPANYPTPEPGFKMTACGWGATEDNALSDVKMKVKLPIVALSECKKKISNQTRISPNQLCAGGEAGRDTCEGDSGGPLMRTYVEEEGSPPQWYQEGIVARGRGCGQKGFPGIYTRVSRYINWILTNVQ